MYIDPELNIAREELLIKVPGGFNAPAKIEDRRGLLEEFLGAIPLNVNVDREDIFIPGPDGAPEVRIRIYRPRSGMWSRSALMVIHGGGMVSGSIEANDSSAAFLCETLGVLTMAVGYRLAPENPFPAGIEDCYSAARWLFTNAESLGVDPQKISLAGSQRQCESAPGWRWCRIAAGERRASGGSWWECQQQAIASANAPASLRRQRAAPFDPHDFARVGIHRLNERDQRAPGPARLYRAGSRISIAWVKPSTFGSIVTRSRRAPQL